MLLDRVAFRILSNINDAAPLRKYVERFYMIGLMVDMLMVFFPCGELVFVLSGVGPILRNGVEFRDKVMLHCSRKMKFQQGFYYLFFQLKPSLLRLRNLKRVFQQTSLLKNNKDSLDILLDRSLFHIPVFKLSLL